MQTPIPLTTSCLWDALMQHQADFETGSHFNTHQGLLVDFLDSHDEKAIMERWTLTDLAKQAERAYDNWSDMDKSERDEWRR